MGFKIAAVGIGLSVLGLGHFFPILITPGAIVLVVGVLFITLDK
jgi:hypothetical protein